MAGNDIHNEAGSQSLDGEVPEISQEREDIGEAIGGDFSRKKSECYGMWRNNEGEYGEGEQLFLPLGERDQEIREYPPSWIEVESEESESKESIISSISEVEETEEEKIAKLEKERLIELLRGKLIERTALRRRNQYLHKKLTEHFKKRRMEHVLKEDPKGLELESKYLKRLFVFQEYKDNQESEIFELTDNIEQFKVETDDLEVFLNETLSMFLQRQKEVSLGLISTKTGNKLNEKVVDRLLRRQELRCAEKGALKLKYVKLKNLIEEKEQQLKALENFGEGLHIMDYEQLKIDNQNYNDKIEEKEEELLKLRIKTQGNMQNLAQVREKANAIEGDIEMLETKFNEVETEYTNKREKVSRAKKRRDYLREEYARMKMQSGLLSNERLLVDFEKNLNEKERIKDVLNEMKELMWTKKKQQREMTLNLNKKSAPIKNNKELDKSEM